nr:reverse transcriptase domain-containing protein [Tanacetum cinerariifolium]
MRTRSSSNLPAESPSNPSTFNPKRRNRRRSKQPFTLEESPIDTMADQRTMAELLRAPTEGAARRWLEKEPPRSILTWEDLVSKFINEFFPPSRTTNLRNEISNFQQRFDESFHEAWDRYKDLLRAYPHHGFTELHQLDTFYNALNPTDQDSLNSAVGGNLLERRTQDVLTIIENNSKQTSAVTTAMTAILKQFQATPPPASVKSVEEICVTCGGAHPYYQCLATGDNTFPELRDNIQGYVAAAVVNYNQGNSGYHPPGETLKLANTPLNENCSAVILKKLPEKLRDPGKFLIPCGFNELKYKALADLGASINLMPLSVWKKLGLPELIFTRMTLELAKRAICTLAGIARDVFVPFGKFKFLADFVIVDYESDPRIEPDQGKLTSVVMKDNLAEPRVHVPNVLATHPTLMLDSDFIPSDNSLPEFKTFYFDIEEKNSGSTTIHAGISLPYLECFNFDFKPDPGELTSIVDSKIC